MLKLSGKNVYIVEYLPGCDLKPYPKPLKKYKQRTLKRWARNSKHYTPPQIFTTYDNCIMCNSRSWKALQDAVSAADTSGWKMWRGSNA